MGDLNGNPLRLSSTEMGHLNGNHGVGSFKRGLQRGIWTPEEDQLLTKYIEAHGEGHWSSLPHKAGLLRGGKSCRLRWMNYLRPNIKRGNISQDEEELIIRMHNLLGNRWTLIAGRIPGRTDNEIKNYWNSHLRKKLCRKASNTLLLDCNSVSNHVQNTRKSEQTSHAEQEHVKNNEESSLLQNATKPDLNIEYNKESGCHASNLHSYFHVLSHLDDCYTYFQGYTDTLSERTKLMDPDIEIDWDEVLDGEAGTSVEDCNHLSGFPLWFEW